MKCLRTMTAATVLAVCASATVALAGNIGVYFDSAASSNSATKGVMVPFTMYVCLTDIQNQINAVEYKVNLPQEIIVTHEQLAGNFANGSSSAGVMVGLGDCINMWNSTDVFVVSTLDAVCFQPISNASITVTKYPVPQPGVTMPRYSTCEPQLIDLTPATATFTSAVPNGESSWGAVKALYNE